MAMSQGPGGRRPIDDDTVNVFAIIGGVFLIIFFLLVIRVYFDIKAGKPVAPLQPTRSPFKNVASRHK